ncbi:ParB/RepB/Spo0J family partition protein [Clostridium sp. DSM 100503]|uniref:ParB/RepB/Spo0J family partition protein n=1 Tax=Clostridium sp. DSM 100503 TaxID=2963282 RepID=UPI002149E457|nr:ParB/RepB/Spo0J family partition protein [Clostridium sp. DSM 100503]MCR1952987.1 ParB/RepB/Spo0J family partition protein [Clostridium sp. DSM 100503]
MAFNMMDLLNNKSITTQDKEENIRKFNITQIHINDLVPSANNFYSIEEIEELKNTIELLGLQQNLVVKKIEGGMYKIIAGHRRYYSILKLYQEGNKNFKYVPCKVEEEDDLRNELRLIITNSTTRDLTDWEKIHQAKMLKELLTEYKEREKIPGRVRDIVADILNVSATQIARMESVSNNLIDDFKEEMKEDKVKISVAYELSKLPKEKQKEVYKEHEDKSNITIKDIKKKIELEDEKEEIEVLEGQIAVEEALNITKEDLKVNQEEELIIEDGKGNISSTVIVDKETGEVLEEQISKSNKVNYRNKLFIEFDEANEDGSLRNKISEIAAEYEEVTTKYKSGDMIINFISNSVYENEFELLVNKDGIEIKTVDHEDCIELYNKIILIAH